MDCTGKIVGITQDIVSGKLNVTFMLNQKPIESLNDLSGIDVLNISVNEKKKKRSLDANAYCWVLCTKIADAVKSSKDEIYEEMLQKYGYIYEDEEGYITITLKKSVDISKMDGHWKYIKDNGKFASYLMIKGSSEYDTKEMSHFIDCIVQEAKELGIETMPPQEIERMLASWQKA